MKKIKDIFHKRKRPKKIPSAQSYRSSLKYKEFRQKVLKRDGHKCRKCSTKNKLTVHHIKNLSGNQGLAYDTKNGITLCRKCHDLRHHIERVKV